MATVSYINNRRKADMEIYDIDLRLGGDKENVLRKRDVTAPEAVLLKELHGPESVKIVATTGMDKRSHEDERVRLDVEYGITEHGAETITRLFGHKSVGGKLPVKVKDAPSFVATEDEPKKAA